MLYLDFKVFYCWSEISGACGNKHDLGPKKLQKYVYETSFYIYIFHRKLFEHMTCGLHAQQIENSYGEAVMVFWPIFFCDGPRKGLTGFQLFELPLPISSMAISYEHSSIQPASS